MSRPIIIMGASGTGKTTFVNILTNSDLPVGSTLEPCTQEIQLSRPFEVHGHNFHFIDTPGDENSDTLKSLVDFLANLYKSRITVAGVFYFQSISSPRVTGFNRRSMRVFEDLCGEQAMKKVTIVITGSDSSSEMPREIELRESPHFFRAAIDEGARYFRFDGTMECARDIVLQAVDVQDTEGEHDAVLKIQDELVNAGRNFSETAVAEYLEADLIEIMRAHEEVVDKLRVTDHERAEITGSLSIQLETGKADFEEILADFEELARDTAELYAQELTVTQCLILFTMYLLGYWLL
ncbi:hypothetical protein D9757_009609 [Collybiopsis confluens]|uniref:Guanylate kinase-like domain-containing protein n=1 Tax=Collybiopsis confluens TaxID=2823264 RepID=A0A8H5H433_9AGAR|nr:hypothetical protein D9757_009609 [Collybiopsis confluens]